MVKNVDFYAKKIMSAGWDYLVKRRLNKKFRLYGSYKAMYKWPQFKLLASHVAFYKKYNYKVNTEWYKYFTLIRQEEDILYIPEDIWHMGIEPVLNQRSYAKAFNDKNLFHTTFYSELLPEAYAHVIQGVIYDSDFNVVAKNELFDLLPNHGSFVVKKSIDTGGGKGVKIYENKRELTSVEFLIGLHGQDFVIQEKVKQHQWFQAFNPSSINTIRVVTYRSVRDEKVHVLQTLFRVGKAGSFVDNQSSGGIAIGINKNGKLNNWGTDKLSVKYSEINGIDLHNSNAIPDFERLIESCKAIAKSRFHERVLVFDTWRDTDNKIRLLEINNINIGIEDLQKNNGPLLGEFTKEILDYCAQNPRSFCFDFEL
jgi:hypothetical protein